MDVFLMLRDWGFNYTLGQRGEIGRILSIADGEESSILHQ